MLSILWSIVPATLQANIVFWLEEHRGLVVLFFCLPASLLFDLLLRFRTSLQRRFSPNIGHEERVQRIQAQVRRYQQQESTKPPGERRLLCSARPNWLSLSLSFFPKHKCNQVPLLLYEILGLDSERRVLRVEPMVTVGQATDYLLKHKFALQVCLEIAEATLGGLAMGVGMTTHSHKAGLFQESIVAYDVVLASGDLVHVTADNEYADLFYTLPWSHGSLAFLVALELRVIPAEPYIRLQYEAVTGSQAAYCARLRDVCGAWDPEGEKNSADFVEVTVFSRNDAVIMQGSFASEEEVRQGRYPVNALSQWYKPWFYKHVESLLHRLQSKGPGTTHTEYVPLRDYLLRHNRAIFWVLEAMLPFGNAPWFRYPLGWLCPPKIAFLKFTTTPGVRALTFVKQVFQDITLPMTELERAIDLTEELFDTYPILLYPCRVYDHGRKGQLRKPRDDQMCPGTNWGMFFDLGVYGVPGPVRRRQPYNPVHTYRTIEKFTRDVGGYPFLYADLFLTREEFEETFDLSAYENVRVKYGAEAAFPHVYEKVKPEVDVLTLGLQYARDSGALMQLNGKEDDKKEK